MAAQVELSRDDYEYAIARIFNRTGHVVGTGFLVAPGYVLTCAHVVLQAMGRSEAEFDQAVAPLGAVITLEFSNAGGSRTEAEVIEPWQGYRIDGGDIASLKLRSAAPLPCKPLPILCCSCEEIQHQTHMVYGFADDQGDRTDAYRPKANAPGGRFQLCKKGDIPPDETIQAGFSGAAVWNADRKGVIGMVATAALPKGERSRAYAIRGQSLRPVVQDLFARSLYDCIQAHLGTDSQRQRVQQAMEAAFKLCDTDGDRPHRPELLDRLQYLSTLSSRNWEQNGQEIDRLTQFAMFLVVMDGLPNELVNAITAWVKYHMVDFEALYFEANRYRQQRQVDAGASWAHLVVQVKPDEDEPQKMYVSIWVIGDRHRYDPLEPMPPRVQDRRMPLAELASFLERWLREESDLDHPILHCFVPRHRLGWNLDASDTGDGLTLGSQYKLVMRTDLSQSPTGKRYYILWHDKWKSGELKHPLTVREALARLNCGDKKQLFTDLRKADMAILENLSREQVGEIFQFIADKSALPIALWVRQEDLCQDLDCLLDVPVCDLPEQILEKRLEAEDETHLGYHLSLVWEDPNVIPPTMVTPFIQ